MTVRIRPRRRSRRLVPSGPTRADVLLAADRVGIGRDAAQRWFERQERTGWPAARSPAGWGGALVLDLSTRHR